MKEHPLLLNIRQREIVEAVIREHCGIREWTLHAVNCCSNHCHVVVTAADYAGELVRDQLKAWATRRLEADAKCAAVKHRQHWWTRKGSVRSIFDEDFLAAAIAYTLEAQNIGGSKANS